MTKTEKKKYTFLRRNILELKFKVFKKVLKVKHLGKKEKFLQYVLPEIFLNVKLINSNSYNSIQYFFYR